MTQIVFGKEINSFRASYYGSQYANNDIWIPFSSLIKRKWHLDTSKMAKEWANENSSISEQ
jgi:hypothetical protein